MRRDHELQSAELWKSLDNLRTWRRTNIIGRRSRDAPTVQEKGESHKTETIEPPRAAVGLLMRILTEMAEGNAVTLMPIHAELTTQQAAAILGASRPFLIKQMKEKKIPFRRVGSHRRVRFDDLMAYKNRIDADRAKALEALAAQRSNVESTVMMVKAKFGDSLRSKTDVAQKNETLAKILCHNICCLIHAVYELKIEAVFLPGGEWSSIAQRSLW